MFAVSVHAQDQATPPLVKQLKHGNWLPQAEAEALRDELYYQHAVFAYMTMLRPVALAEQTRVYPLWAVEKDVKPMVFPNGSGKQVNMM
jgi:hypothetical protein